MKFHEWKTLWDTTRKAFPSGVDMIEAYSAQMKADERDGEALSYACNVAELRWYHESRPYYKAFPAITKAISSLKLDCSYECPTVPRKCVLVRFAVGSEVVTESEFRIGAILVSECRMRRASGEDRNGLLMMVQSEDVVYKADDDANSYAFVLNPETTNGITIEEVIAEADVLGYLRGNESEVKQVQSVVTRISLMVCMLADDPSIITPDVLSKDRDEYDRTTDEAWKERAVERARRRGVVGWNIGADYEVCPHYRRPHFGLRHTGKGGTVPRIVPIKGAVVHRSRLTEVPTGYMLPDGTEVEHGSVVSGPA